MMILQHPWASRIRCVLALLLLDVEGIAQDEPRARAGDRPAVADGMIAEWSVRLAVPPVEVDGASSALGDGRSTGCLVARSGEKECVVAWLGDRVYLMDMVTGSASSGDFKDLVQVFAGQEGAMDVVCGDGLHKVNIESFPRSEQRRRAPNRFWIRDAAACDEGWILRSGPYLVVGPLDSEDPEWRDVVLRGLDCRAVAVGAGRGQWFLATQANGERGARCALECLNDGRRQAIDRSIPRPSAIVGDLASEGGRVLTVGRGWAVHTLQEGKWKKESVDSGYFCGAAWLQENEFVTWDHTSIAIWTRASTGSWSLSAEHHFKATVGGVAPRGPGLLVVCLRVSEGLEVVSVKRRSTPIVDLRDKSLPDPK